jgi:hypothetical protein
METTSRINNTNNSNRKEENLSKKSNNMVLARNQNQKDGSGDGFAKKKNGYYSTDRKKNSSRKNNDDSLLLKRPIILAKPSSSSQLGPSTTPPPQPQVSSILEKKQEPETNVDENIKPSNENSNVDNLVITKDQKPNSSIKNTTGKTIGPITLNTTQIPTIAKFNVTKNASPILTENRPVSTSNNPLQQFVEAISSRLSVGVQIMHQPLPLLDENLKWQDSLNDFLLDQNDYLVIGVLGKSGVGKSTIMSLLAGESAFDIAKSKASLFKTSNNERLEQSSHRTSGILAYITNERTILLDVQVKIFGERKIRSNLVKFKFIVLA